MSHQKNVVKMKKASETDNVYRTTTVDLIIRLPAMKNWLLHNKAQKVVFSKPHQLQTPYQLLT
jgi:hypothetical protein